MPDKKITIRRGDKLTISINRKQKKKPQVLQTAGNSASGLLKTRKDSDYLARRKRPGGIKFFDLGQIPNGDGTFSDMNFRFVPAATLTPSSGVLFEPLDDSQWDLIRDEILAVENFDSHSRLIEQPHLKYLQLYLQIGNPDTADLIGLLDNPRFAGDSFTFTAADLENNAITLYTGLGDIGNEFQTIRLKDALNEYEIFNKFTLEPDFDADAVSFSVTNQDKIYIVPKFKFWNAELETQGATGTPPESNLYILNKIYRLKPNSVFLDPENPFFNYADVVGIFVPPGDPLPAQFVEHYHQIVEMMTADADARAFLQNVPEGGGTLISSIIDVEDFPDEEIEETNSFNLTNNTYAGFRGTPSPSGFLLAIITRGSQKFYCWKA